MNSHTLSRRSALASTDGIAATAATSTVSVPNPAAANAGFGVGGIHAIPDLAPQWKKLDLAEILSYQRRVKGSNEGIWPLFIGYGKQGLSD
jgi:hypothetical protein